MNNPIQNIADRKYIKGSRQARAILKYLINRNDAGQRMTHEMYLERVLDRGLGTSWQNILGALEESKSQYVTMWMHVLSPDPVLQQLIPAAQRKAAVAEMADLYVESLYQGLGFAEPVYTVMIHDSLASNNLQRFHAHIVLGGTCEDRESGMPRNVFIEKRKGHFEVSDLAREAALDQVMVQRVGLDWKKRIPALPDPAVDWEAALAQVDLVLAARAVPDEVPDPTPARPARLRLVDFSAPAPEVSSPDLDLGL